MKRFCLIGIGFLFLAAPAWAAEEVVSDATPDALAIESPDVTLGYTLGRDVAAFDLKTWRIVAKFWNQPERSLFLVDDHMVGYQGRVLAQFAELGAVQCRVDAAGNWVIGTGNAERDAAFAEAYAKRLKTVAATRASLLEDPSMKKVAAAVQVKEREFRHGICAKIMANEESAAPAETTETEEP